MIIFPKPSFHNHGPWNVGARLNFTPNQIDVSMGKLIVCWETCIQHSYHIFFRLQNRGDNMFDSVCPSVRLSTLPFQALHQKARPLLGAVQKCQCFPLMSLTSNTWKNGPLYAFNATGGQISYQIQYVLFRSFDMTSFDNVYHRNAKRCIIGFMGYLGT